MQTLASDLPQPPRGLHLDATTQRLNWLSYSTSSDGTVQSIGLDGSGLETRYSASATPQPLVT